MLNESFLLLELVFFRLSQSRVKGRCHDDGDADDGDDDGMKPKCRWKYVIFNSSLPWTASAVICTATTQALQNLQRPSHNRCRCCCYCYSYHYDYHCDIAAADDNTTAAATVMATATDHHDDEEDDDDDCNGAVTCSLSTTFKMADCCCICHTVLAAILSLQVHFCWQWQAILTMLAILAMCLVTSHIMAGTGAFRKQPAAQPAFPSAASSKLCRCI